MGMMGMHFLLSSVYATDVQAGCCYCVHMYDTCTLIAHMLHMLVSSIVVC